MEECKGFDLTPVQYASLVAVRDYPGIDATRLSALIAFDRSTLGSVIERLEAKELIVRRPIPEDRRLKLLHLTTKGRQLLTKVIPAVNRAQQRMLEPLQAADRKVLMALLGQLVHLNNDVSRAPMRIGAGWLAGTVAGIAVGFAIGLSSLARGVGITFISALFPIPKIALLPLLILWLGIGEAPKIATIALGVFFSTAISVYSGVDSVPRNLIRMHQSRT